MKNTNFNGMSLGLNAVEMEFLVQIIESLKLAGFELKFTMDEGGECSVATKDEFTAQLLEVAVQTIMEYRENKEEEDEQEDNDDKIDLSEVKRVAIPLNKIHNAFMLVVAEYLQEAGVNISVTDSRIASSDHELCDALRVIANRLSA